MSEDLTQSVAKTSSLRHRGRNRRWNTDGARHQRPLTDWTACSSSGSTEWSRPSPVLTPSTVGLSGPAPLGPRRYKTSDGGITWTNEKRKPARAIRLEDRSPASRVLLISSAYDLPGRGRREWAVLGLRDDERRFQLEFKYMVDPRTGPTHMISCATGFGLMARRCIRRECCRYRRD